MPTKLLFFQTHTLLTRTRFHEILLISWWTFRGWWERASTLKIRLSPPETSWYLKRGSSSIPFSDSFCLKLLKTYSYLEGVHQGYYLYSKTPKIQPGHVLFTRISKLALFRKSSLLSIFSRMEIKIIMRIMSTAVSQLSQHLTSRKCKQLILTMALRNFSDN